LRRTTYLLVLICCIAGMAPCVLAQDGTATPAARCVTVTAWAAAPAWVRVFADGKVVASRILPPNQQATWTANNRIVIVTGNAAGLHLKVNGMSLGPMGKREEYARAVFGPESFVKPTAPKPPVAVMKPKPSISTPTIPEAKPAIPPPPPGPSFAERLRKWFALIDPYANAAGLVILLLMLFWMIGIIRRERILLAAGTVSRTGDIKLVSSLKVGWGKSVYLFDISGRLFLMGTGGLRLLNEIQPRIKSGR
jgi:hypothetical protein